jgi:Trk K+ transport system NAD-binding subunit
MIVLDYNPEIIQALSKQKVSCIYGDASNIDLLNQIPSDNLRIVLSTVPKKEDNLFVIRHFKKVSKNVFVIVTAQKIDEALEFYKAGADYVLLPIIIGAEQCLSMIKKLNKKEFSELKSEHIKYLQDLHRYLY